MEPELGSRDWRTLELAPLWVLCAVTGRQSGFHPLELAAFWRSVDSAAAGADGLANAVPVSLSSNFSSMLKGFEQEQRSVVTGLWDVVGILTRLDVLVAKPFVAMLLEIGESFSRARGSAGRIGKRCCCWRRCWSSNPRRTHSTGTPSPEPLTRLCGKSG